MKQQPIQIDPLNSPFPVPWNWILAIQSEHPTPAPKMYYYRSPSLISPDHHYAAYSRIQLRVAPDFTQNQVSSVLFIENLHTGELHPIIARSAFADHPSNSTASDAPLGTIAILIPVGWSETGDRMLAREFESMFGTDIASDFAVVWNRPSKQLCTVAPSGISYTTAVLLGWSHHDRDRVLFRAGHLGEDNWQTWAVDCSGDTTIAPNDQPIIYGQLHHHIWAGPQADRG
jgi:hypothetical protein